MDCRFVRKLSTDHAFLASGIRVERNLKVLLIKATKSFGGGTRRGILSSINENLGGSYCAEQW